MSFTTLSELRKTRGNFDALMKAVEKLDQPNNKRDSSQENIWKPTVDKAGNGYAVLRFLPAPSGEDFPWVQIYDHGFQGPTGKWYIEKSLTTLGQADPCSELNSELWNSGLESNKEIARKQKRRLSFYANVLIVNDSGNPANNGSVMLYKFGKKIFDKIKDAMNPGFADEASVNPFDFWTGANFKLKIRKVEGYQNYDKSEFESPSPISADDVAIEAIWKKQTSLQELVNPKNFKSYAELKTKLSQVLGGGKAIASAEQISNTTGDVDDDSFVEKVVASKSTAVNIDDDDDDTMSYFSKLANS